MKSANHKKLQSVCKSKMNDNKSITPRLINGARNMEDHSNFNSNFTLKSYVKHDTESHISDKENRNLNLKHSNSKNKFNQIQNFEHKPVTYITKARVNKNFEAKEDSKIKTFKKISNNVWFIR